MAITTGTALLLGVLAGGTAAYFTQKAAKPQQQAQTRVREQQLEAQQKATAEVLAAPEKASERARLESLERRKKRARTLLTSPMGVLEPATLEKKTLLGE